MADDLAVEAKEAAMREVAKLLPTQEILASIASIKADYITRQQVQIQILMNVFCLNVRKLFAYL